MVDSIAITSIFGHRPLYSRYCFLDKFRNKSKLGKSLFHPNECAAQQAITLPRIKRQTINRSLVTTTRAHAMELTKEAYSSREENGISRGLNYSIDTGYRKAGTWPPSNKADNPNLHNPLLRLKRMGCGWLGAIFEWEGVIVEDSTELEKQSWLVLSEDEGKSPPPAFILRRIEGMKNEQAISEVLCWSRDPTQVRRLAVRKEEIYQSLLGGFYRLRSGSQEFVTTLVNYKIPTALVSSRSRKNLEEAIDMIGFRGYFNVIVAAEDVYRGKPDPEMFIYAAQSLDFIAERCIVFGNSNSTVEAAHDARMKCIAVASKHPMYELGAADLVVRHLNELSIIDLKNLAAVDSAEFDSPEPELEMEEEEDLFPSTSVSVDDNFW